MRLASSSCEYTTLKLNASEARCALAHNTFTPCWWVPEGNICTLAAVLDVVNFSFTVSAASCWEAALTHKLTYPPGSLRLLRLTTSPPKAKKTDVSNWKPGASWWSFVRAAAQSLNFGHFHLFQTRVLCQPLMLRVGQCDCTDCDTIEICQPLNVNTTTASVWSWWDGYVTHYLLVRAK